MLNHNHIAAALLPYLRSLLSFIFLEAYLILCIAFKLRLLGHDSARGATSRREQPPNGHWGWTLFMSLTALWAQLVILGVGTGDVFFDHALGCNATTTLFVGFHFLVADSRSSRCQQSQVETSSQTSGKVHGRERGSPGWETWLGMAYALRMAPRQGSGQRGPLNKADLRTATTRHRFLVHRMFHLLSNFLLLDVLNTVAFAFPFFQPTPSRGPRPFRLQELPLSLLHGGMIYAGLNVMYDAYALLSVASQSTAPDEWPPLFGDVRDAWTVQRAWSRVWHQLMRNHLSSTSTYLLQLLPRSSVLSPLVNKTIQVALAFILSGVLHVAGEYHCLRALQVHNPLLESHSSPESTTLRFGGVTTTFALQPLALLLESLASSIARRRPAVLNIPLKWRSCSNFLMKFIGYLWVIAWFSFSMSFYTRSMMGAGFMTSTANMPRGWTMETVRFVTRNVLYI
ncbi:hypothetical protein NMY22_g13134 [Coprinellus aureogranulatus]|nr:hypothetical protein NMY22_g13134 [Coprinellus aureogranulatus]